MAKYDNGQEAPPPTMPIRRLVVLAALAIGCGLLAGYGALPGRGVHPVHEGPLEAVRLPMEFHGEKVWPHAEYVARTEAQWEQAWSQGRSTDPRNDRRPRDGRPMVDFSRHMVIGVSRGYGVQCTYLDIRDVVERPGEIEVQFVHLWPSREELDEVEQQMMDRPSTTMCIASSVLLVRWYLLPQSSKRVRFVRIRARGPDG